MIAYRHYILKNSSDVQNRLSIIINQTFIVSAIGFVLIKSEL